MHLKPIFKTYFSDLIVYSRLYLSIITLNMLCKMIVSGRHFLKLVSYFFRKYVKRFE